MLEEGDMTSQSGLRSDDSRLTDAARNVAQQAEQTAEAKASTTMHQFSSAIDGVAHAIRRASDDLRQEQPQLASFADTAAGQVDRASQYLKEHEPRDLLDALEDTARRQPALLIAGGIAVGLVLGRLLRSAAPTGEGSYASGDRRGTPYGYTGGRFGVGPSTGNGGGRRSSDVGDPSASIVAGTRVVRPGSQVDTGSPGNPRR
jgi:hypothetical protein